MPTGSTAPFSAVARSFGDARCRSIWQWQLVIAFTVVTISGGIALLAPVRFTDACFSAGLLLLVAISVGSLAFPWHRVGSAVVLLLPLTDIAAISLVAVGDVPVVAFLWVLPVSWIATYYSAGVLIAALALITLISGLGVVVIGITVATTINAVALIITLGFVGMIMSVGSQRNRSSAQLLRTQSARLARALQRVNEQKARTNRLMNSLDLGLARVGAGGVLEVSNETFRTIFALGGAAQQHPIRSVEYYSRRGAAIPSEETTIARASRGEQFKDRVVWLFGLDGEWRAVRASTKSIEHGIVTGDGQMLVVEDITASADPRASENAKRRTISHELRNPLTAILGHVDLLLEREDLPDAALEQLRVVERAGARMERLIDDALSVPGAIAEDSEVDFDLAQIARSSLEGFAPAADSAGVIVESSLDEPLPLRADAFRIRQVVDNVIGNAVKYAQRGGRVSVAGFPTAEQEVALIVADTGIGISEHELPRVFEREYRTELARARGIPGTGLGLSISRDIVLAAGGRLEIDSELGKGTRVTVVLPASAAPAAPAAPDAPDQGGSA
ncbi:HAMP domain-containing sensor histidine kinase [Microbacterium sp. ARD32]|uniref:sensor histidine kinase n=1 Tax=Microbacterium sp. ARD32 TaxID=2962577 RepID=UPI0028814726|nr:HAMP domain-containing sensor histidine kinase [Microbacterium sp. ARD32]MDT0156390.1 HAMP domain-containing sensor histidine kinase [Microbacterium sp. ARD32]